MINKQLLEKDKQELLEKIFINSIKLYLFGIVTIFGIIAFFIIGLSFIVK